MAARTDSFDLGRLGLTSGEARHLDLTVGLEPLRFGEETYSAGGETAVRLDVDRTTGGGYALRLRFGVQLDGPCMRCLEGATPAVEVDAREIEQPAVGDEDLISPYIEADELDLRAWARDALALALPTQIVCDEDCRGLCAVCGENLNGAPEHAHEPEPDPRWAKLSELKLD